MALRLTGTLKAVLIVAIVTTVSGDDDRDLKFCGTWHHGRGLLSLNVNLSTGCEQILISANESSLSVHGKITTQCSRLATIPLKRIEKTETQSSFCLYWEPLLDQLKMKIQGEIFPLCQPSSVKNDCCTYLSNDVNQPESKNFGIANVSVNNDSSSVKKRIAYVFNGTSINCRTEFCHKLRAGNTQNPCAPSTVLELKDDVEDYKVTLPAPRGIQAESIPTIHLPSSLKRTTRMNNQVVCSYFRNNSLFQEGPTNGKVLVYVVAITIENEVIKDLAEPIRIGFSHDVIAKTHSRKCVSWDTKNDPLKVNWVVDGCETRKIGEKQTECLCNHLTYFTVLVQLKPKPVRHLLALTAITSLGCAVSLISCIALIIYLYRKSRKPKEHSTLVHIGLAVSLALLNLLFFSTGVLANVGGESVCVWVGAVLHYALLSSLIWMGIEVLHTFWLVHMVFKTSPKPWVWFLIGFALPAVPVVILSTMKDIYGLKKISPSDDLSNPYQMCWMKTNSRALLAHYVTNVTLLAILVSSGLVMLCLVYREIRNRDEWRQNRVAFLSIWGLSCLFGTTWGLTFLDFGPLADFILFLSCILNSFQGFLLMLRFFLLGWMRKQAGGSVLNSSSTTGSTRQHMLQSQEKS